MGFDGGMTTSTTTLEVLTYDECLALLGSGGVGRLAWAEPDRVVVVPVNFAWDGDAIVFRTDPGQKVDGMQFQRIAFRDRRVRRGPPRGLERPSQWHSPAHGPRRLAQSRQDTCPARARTLGSGSKEQWMRLVPDRLTGRRLVHQRPGNDVLWRYSAYS